MVKSDDSFLFLPYQAGLSAVMSLFDDNLHLQTPKTSGNANVLEFWARAVKYCAAAYMHDSEAGFSWRPIKLETYECLGESIPHSKHNVQICKQK